MLRVVLAVVALLLGACHPVDLLPAPPLEDAAGALLAYEQDGALAFVQAMDPAAPTFPTLAPQGGERLHVARFDCSLDRIGLSEGPVSLVEGVTSPPQVPAPTGTSRLALGEDDEAWASPAEPDPIWSEVLGRLPVPANNLCQLAVPPDTGAERILDVTETQDIVFGNFALDLRDGRVLIATQFYPDFSATSTTGSAVYLYDDTAARPEARRWPAVDDLGAILAGARLGDGQMWLLGYENLWRGHPDTGFEVVTSTVHPLAPERAHLATSPDGRHVYLVTQSLTGDGAGQAFGAVRRLLVLEPQGWRTVVEYVETEAQRDRARVAWVGEDRFVVTGLAADSAVLDVSDAGVEPVVLGTRRMRHAQSLPGGGAIVSSSVGGLYVRTLEGWETIREDGHPGLVEFVQRRPGAWAIYGWVGGGVGVPKLTDDFGLCDEPRLSGALPRVVDPVGDGAMALLRSTRGGALRLARLAPGDEIGSLCP